ncbi:nuclear body protein SP140-like [Acomys russatus]|uniref:nuclear body protein SP140-like n=1 Tax=Acomys russatus TaxID=60746 RepID=UPI0021E31E87|nr:nuclear body protein SP140-like [Acomys russatus]
MAGGDNGLRKRTITEDHNEEESADYQLVVNHFRENKVEIASAITKPFPFLMSLRDRCIISEEKFQDCEERCEKQEPVERVVYDILSDVQKKFSWQLLKVIFSKAHLKAYPDLEEILQNFFQNALDNHRTFERMNGRDAEKRPRLSAVDREASHMNDDGAEELPSLPQCNGGGGSSSCEQVFDGREPRDDFFSSLRCEAHASRAYGQAAFRRMKMIKSPGCSKLRVLRRHRSENAHFNAELLPVTCGDMKGVLHKHKFKQGVSMMSIQCENGNWFTPSEFEIMGGHGRSKNWKLSLRCYNRPLKFLIKVLRWRGRRAALLTAPLTRNFLPNPPRKYAKRKQQSGKHRHSGCFQRSEPCSLYVLSFRTPWSCIFCRIQSLGSQESCPESEILQRQMSPQEQLKCEFVLLKVYCCPERSFFSKMPYYCYFSDVAGDVSEPMWLDRIKRKLSAQAYSKVEEFVNDMRLIFQNHRSTFKDAKFGQIGLILESKFETNFKEVFAVQETNENS